MDLDFSRDGGLYAEEKFIEAVDELIVGRGAFADRLTRAIFVLSRLSRGGAPVSANAELQRRFDRMMSRVTSTPAWEDEGMIVASVRGLDDTEADWIAREIVALYIQVVGEKGGA